jgi:hypothetical protein
VAGLKIISKKKFDSFTQQTIVDNGFVFQKSRRKISGPVD